MLTVSRPLGRDLCRVGWIAAATIAALTVAWLITLAFIPGPPTDATLAARLSYLADHPETGLGAALVVGIALLYIPVWLGLAALAWSRRPAAGVLAVAFGLVYASMASITYWTQLTVVRGLADLSRTDPAGAAAAYRLFEFPGGLTSLAYGLDILAYAVWGLAALSIAVGLLDVPARVAQATGAAFATGGILALVGAFGFVIESDALELAVLLSGVASLVAVALTVVALRSGAADPSLVAGLSFEVRLAPSHR